MYLEVTFCTLKYQHSPLIDHLRMAKGLPFHLHKAALEGLDARLRKEVMASEGAKELFEKATASLPGCQESQRDKKETTAKF